MASLILSMKTMKNNEKQRRTMHSEENNEKNDKCCITCGASPFNPPYIPQSSYACIHFHSFLGATCFGTTWHHLQPPGTTFHFGGAHPPPWGCAPPFVHNDEFSSTLMEQRTLDAIGVLIISTTAGGGVLSRLRCNVDEEGGKYTEA